MPDDGVVCEFCFHGVGHGLFYTGKIGDFNFVYDCGSSSPTRISAKAERFARNHLPEVAGKDRKVKLLPFLFISHLHYDHVSGLQGLFEAGVRVDYAFLPYLSPWERLLLALAVPDNALRASPWYLDLLRDPVDFFIGQGVKKVIVLTTAGSGGSRGPLQFGPIDIDGLPGHHVYLKGLERLDEAMEKSILSQEDSSWERHCADGQLWFGLPTPDSNEVRGLILWEFVLYCVPMSEDKIVCFRQWLSSQPSVRSFLREHADNALALLSDSSFLKELRKRYCYLLTKERDLNFSSLVLWHAPLMGEGNGDTLTPDGMDVGYCLDYSGASGSLDMTRVEACLRKTCCSFLKLLGWENKSGQFLPGDLNFCRLIRDRRMYAHFRKHFGDRLNATIVCLLPHHGSRYSWNREVLRDMESVKFWVASAGGKGNYPPHWEVVADVTSRGGTFVWVGGTTHGSTGANYDTSTNTLAEPDYVILFTFQKKRTNYASSVLSNF